MKGTAFKMRLVFNVRERINRVVVAAVGAVFLVACGASLAFVLAPRQALEARHVERLPEMVAEDVAAAEPGDEVLITGRLEDNPVIAEGRFVAYTRDTWQVTVPTPSSQADSQGGKPTGQWKTVERVVPDLTLSVNGRTVEILRARGAAMSGPLHERLDRAYFSYREAEYHGEMLAEGSERLRGFHNGDLVTVLGVRASGGGVIPDELFAGDRVAFVEGEKKAAQGLLICGLCMMGVAPIVVVGGIVSALLGRRRR
jgi:hypothetical protein